jgi:MFS family permease
MWTILLIAFFQMPHLALTPGIDSIQRQFPERSIAAIQTVLAMSNLLCVAAGIAAAALIRMGVISKKSSVLAGLALMGATGLAAFALRAQFWQLGVLSVLLGTALGLLIPSAQSIMLDGFDGRELRVLTGSQSSFINAGGIALGLSGGLLISATGAWYAPYGLFLLVIPVALLAAKTLPAGRRQAADGARGRLRRGVYFYAGVIFVFMIVYNVLAANLSTHLAREGEDAAASGVAVAFMMAGGVVSGLFFPKLSAKLRDGMIPLAFFELFVGYTMMNLFAGSLPATLAASLICGMSLSSLVPQCNFAVGELVDPSISSVAAMLIGSIAPSSGSFLSPVLLTNATERLFGESTRARYHFTGFVSLALAVLLLLWFARRARRTPPEA